MEVAGGGLGRVSQRRGRVVILGEEERISGARMVKKVVVASASEVNEGTRTIVAEKRRRGREEREEPGGPAHL